MIFETGNVSAQAQLATTPESSVYSTNVACTSGVACTTGIFPFAQMGVGIDYQLQYANSGAFKTEFAGNEVMTWVSDYEMNDWYNGKSAIAHWDQATGGTTSSPGYTELNLDYPDEDNEWDPDVVQWEDNLFAVYYSIEYLNGQYFPGNGVLPGDKFRVRFEEFTSTDNPVSTNNSEINVTSFTDLEYAKSPNIDVSLIGDVVMAWEEKDENETDNHIFAKAWDPVNGLYNSNYLDLDASVLEFDMIYNPDITVAIIDDQSVDPDDYPVYITFIGVNHSGVTLNVYRATVDDLKTGAVGSTSNLTTLATMTTHANLSVGDPVKDYLYRPRIASHPKLAWVSTGGSSGFPVDQYNVVVPRINKSLATDIMSYTKNNTVITATTHTQTPASSVDTDDSMNYEPLTEVNLDGYEVVWINDQGQLLSGLSNSTTLSNPMSSALSGYFEQTILRKRIDWNGSSFYSDYSLVPEGTEACCFTYAPSVAFDRQQLITGPTGPNAYKAFYGFQYSYYDQKTHYKLSTYTNTSMKHADGETLFPAAMEDQPMQLQKLNASTWQIQLPAIEDLSVSVLDVQGRTLPIQVINASKTGIFTLDLGQTPSGVYIVKASSPQGEWSSKLIK